LIKNNKINPGSAKKVEKIKKLYQPKVVAKIPALAAKKLRATVAREASIAYCVALKEILHNPLR
jgi:hypothetical protein